MQIKRPSGQTALDILGKDKETVIRELNNQYDFAGEIKINELVQLEIEKIEVEEQVRTEFSEAELNELAEDIKENGIIQPLIVRPENGKYILVIGERRYRASKIAGLESIPCVVKNINKEDVPLLQLFENIQRKDLTWDELNKVVQGFADKGMSIRQIADKIHKDKSFVEFYLDVSKFSDEEKQKLKEGVALSKIREVHKIQDNGKRKEVLNNLNKLSRDDIKKIKNKSKPRKLSKNKDKNGVSDCQTPSENQNQDKDKNSETGQKTTNPESGQTRQITPPDSSDFGNEAASTSVKGSEIRQKLEFNETKEDRIEIKELIKKFENILSMKISFQTNALGKDEITIQAGTKTLIDIIHWLKKKFNLN